MVRRNEVVSIGYLVQHGVADSTITSAEATKTASGRDPSALSLSGGCGHLLALASAPLLTGQELVATHPQPLDRAAGNRRSHELAASYVSQHRGGQAPLGGHTAEVEPPASTEHSRTETRFADEASQLLDGPRKVAGLILEAAGAGEVEWGAQLSAATVDGLGLALLHDPQRLTPEQVRRLLSAQLRWCKSMGTDGD